MPEALGASTTLSALNDGDGIGLAALGALNQFTSQYERKEDTYGATAAFAGDRWEIHLGPAARTGTAAILGRRIHRVKFRDAMTIGMSTNTKGQERREREKGASKNQRRRRGERGCENPRARPFFDVDNFFLDGIFD